jgi:hypothetical protein
LRETSPKKRYRKERGSNLRLLLANLFIAYDKKPGTHLKYYRTNRAYCGESRYRPSFVSAKVIAALVDALERVGLVWSVPGYKDLESERSAMSLVCATDLLTGMFDEFALYPFLFEKSDDCPLVLLKSKKTGKQKRRSLIEYPKGWQPVTEMDQFLRSYNEFLSSITIAIHIPSELRSTAYKDRSEQDGNDKDNDAGFGFDTGGHALYRVFSNVDPEHLNLDQGGRFYGARWINLKSEFRSLIAINREPTTELDYSTFHPGMIYHLEGIGFDGELYSVPAIREAAGEFDPGALRNTQKKLTNILINASKRQIRHALKMPREQTLKKWEITLPENLELGTVMEMIEEYHSPIAKHFGSGIGLKLQSIDAGICEKILAYGLATDTPILPIHDSYIVRDRDAEMLEQWMIAAYRDIVGPFDPKIKRKGREVTSKPIAHREPLVGRDIKLDNFMADYSQNRSSHASDRVGWLVS